MDIQAIKTKSGKTIKDFTVPEKLVTGDPELVMLIMQSESMDDGEKQYWFNLTEAMSKEQVEKLRDILVREKQKLAEIDTKYGKKEKEDPAVAKLRIEKTAERQAAQRERLRSQERAVEEQEQKEEEEILKELETL
ncbi:hypothetical protein K9M41_00875 [Candidatus Gracilibacteria bacterium]|nr:hypothetical protein [Candidatus Gracilibacteria bacterium]